MSPALLWLLNILNERFFRSTRCSCSSTVALEQVGPSWCVKVAEAKWPLVPADTRTHVEPAGSTTSEDRPFSSINDSSGAGAPAGGEPDMRERLAAFYAAADDSDAAAGSDVSDWALEPAAADLIARASAPAGHLTSLPGASRGRGRGASAGRGRVQRGGSSGRCGAGGSSERPPEREQDGDGGGGRGGDGGRGRGRGGRGGRGRGRSISTGQPAGAGSAGAQSTPAMVTRSQAAVVAAKRKADGGAAEVRVCN